jgi:hypothetical protein
MPIALHDELLVAADPRIPVTVGHAGKLQEVLGGPIENKGGLNCY